MSLNQRQFVYNNAIEEDQRNKGHKDVYYRHNMKIICDVYFAFLKQIFLSEKIFSRTSRIKLPPPLQMDNFQVNVQQIILKRDNELWDHPV